MQPMIIGIIGSLILVIGAAWPVAQGGHPAASRKNQFFALGNALMFVYALLRYFEGGSLLFILLQILIAISTVLMLLDTPDTRDTFIISFAAAALVTYSFFVSHGVEVMLFVTGLSMLGIGFAMDMATVRRQMALALGSVLIAVFSYLQRDAIFLWLNIFFAVFSLWHAWQLKYAAKP